MYHGRRAEVFWLKHFATSLQHEVLPRGIVIAALSQTLQKTMPLLNPAMQPDHPPMLERLTGVPLSSKRTTNAQNRHTTKSPDHTQSPRMRQIQTLAKQLQSHTGHNPRRHGKHGAIDSLARRPVAVTGDFEPEGGDTGADGLGEAAKDEGDEHGAEAVVDSEIEGEGHGKAFGDVVDEEGEEDGEAEAGVGVVRGVGYEAFGELVQGDGDGGLEAD